MVDVQLYLGDCLTILPMLADRSVDAIITDLPYGRTACAWDVVIPFEPMWREVKRILKPHGAFVTTASQPFTSMLVMSNLEWFRYEWIWEKSNGSNFASTKTQPMRTHEHVLVFTANGRSIYNPQMTWHEDNRKRKIKRRASYESDVEGVYGPIHRTNSEFGKERYPRSVLRIPSPPRNNQFVSCYNAHPTQKPLALYEYLIRTYTNEGDIVLDFCMGSGTTGKACIQTGRNFIGVEILPEYYEIAQRGITEAQAQLRLPEVEHG